MSKAVGLISIVLLIVLFLGVNVTADRVLAGARIDLTEGSLYSVRPATKRIAKSPAEPITIRLYYSKDLARGLPTLESFGRRVVELLRSFESSSDGKIRVEIINPEPFSEAEDEAVAEGITPQPLSQTENLYFGLVATNALDGREVIPMFRPQEERFLEFRFAQLVTRLASTDKPTLGLISGLDMGESFDPATRQPRPEWGVLRELRTSFEIEQIAQDAGAIPESVDLLLVVHPKDVTPATEYAIDQYVLGGGRAVVFLDPHCESDRDPMQQQMMQVGVDKSSTLPTLFPAWGVQMDTSVIVGDLSMAIEVQVPGPRTEIVPYVTWLGVNAEHMSEDDPITGNLSRMNLASAGSFKLADDAAVTMEPLIETTDQSAVVQIEKVRFMPNPKALLNEFFPDGETRVIAARLTGTPGTAFPDGPPAGVTEATEPDDEASDEDADSGEVGGETEAPSALGQLIEAADPINVIVVADADMLDDASWIRAFRIGQAILGYDVFADNGAFAVNAAEQMAGSTDLLSLRGRGSFSRPFTVLEEMAREAEAESAARVETLEQEMQQVETRLSELLRGQVDAGASSLVLTPEMQAEVDQLRETQLGVRKELRDVQLNLRKDIESLETRLKLINTAMVPALLCVFALGLGGYRAMRRRADRRRGSLR